MNNNSDNKAYFLKDTALISKENDEFHHEDYVKNLKKIILEHDPPYNIALIGKWGVGKSSIINLLREELRGRPEIRTHEINAWKYENDSLKKAFLKNLYKEFNPDVDLSVTKKWGEDFRKGTGSVDFESTTVTPLNAIKNTFPIVKTLITLWIIVSIFILMVLYAFDGINAIFTDNTFVSNIKNTFDYFTENIWVSIIVGPFLLMLQSLIQAAVQRSTADIHFIKPIETADEYEELFKKEIESYKKKNKKFKKLVVIVDDLDRLTTKKVVAALDAIKAFVEINECIFIVTCDDNILINALEKEKLNKSLDVDGELFLDKLFHFRVSLPPIIERDMSDFAIKIAEQEAPGLVKACNGLFHELTDILIHTDVSTPRQVKKILNTFANNLLIARARESDGRKLEDKLLTNNQGLRYLAKISVIQSDYNEVYGELVKDYRYLEDLLSFYQLGEEESEVNKPSVKKFFNFKSNSYHIKHDFEGLMNFLTRTEHINVDNVAPFIYLGQDAIGLNTGDEKQRTILQSLTNGNEKPVIEILEVANEKVYLIQAIIEVIKLVDPKDLPAVIKGAVPLVKHIGNDRKDFSNMISFRLNSINLSQIRYWQLNLSDLLLIYFSSDNKVGIEKAILKLLEELFNKSKNWKNINGKELSNKGFTDTITDSLRILFNVEENLSESIRHRMKNFLNDNDGEYNFYSFENIHEIYLEYPQYFDDYFGLPFYYQLVDDLQVSKDKLFKLEIDTFYKIAPKIRSMDTQTIIKSLPTIIKLGGSEYLLSSLRLVLPIVKNLDEEAGTSIVGAVTSVTVREEEVEELISILQKIPFNLDLEDNLIGRFDNFILKLLLNEDAELRIELIDLMHYSMKQSQSNFSIYESVYEHLLDGLLESSMFDDLITAFDSEFTEEQRSKLLEKLKAPVTLNSYNPVLFERVSTLYSILVNQEENYHFIKETMKLGIHEFRNNRWIHNLNWANDFVSLFSITSFILDEADIRDFLSVLEGYVTQTGHTDIAIKGLKNIGKYLPENKVISLRTYSIKNSKSDSSKMDAFLFLKSTRNYASKENENLNEYLDFLIENFHLKIESFLEELTSFFSSIPSESIIQILINSSKLNEEVFNSKLPVIQNTVEKFYLSLNEKVKETVLLSTIKEEVNIKWIDNILLESLDNSSRTSLLNNSLRSDILKEKEVKIALLKLCERTQDTIDNSSFTSLIINMLNEEDDDYIIDTCNTLLDKFSKYRFNKEKKRLSTQMVYTFRRVNFSAKKILLEVSKVFLLEDAFRENLKIDVFSEEEEKLILNILKFRPKKNRLLRRD